MNHHHNPIQAIKAQFNNSGELFAELVNTSSLQFLHLHPASKLKATHPRICTPSEIHNLLRKIDLAISIQKLTKYA